MEQLFHPDFIVDSSRHVGLVVQDGPSMEAVMVQGNGDTHLQITLHYIDNQAAKSNEERAVGREKPGDKKDEDPNLESVHIAKYRRWFSWIVLGATTVWGVFVATWLGWHSWQPDSWVLRMVQEHFAALIGVPMAALIAMCVVLLLRFSAGPIEFKAFGVEFEGASGQVVFWVLCFLSIVSSLKLLW